MDDVDRGNHLQVRLLLRFGSLLFPERTAGVARATNRKSWTRKHSAPATTQSKNCIGSLGVSWLLHPLFAYGGSWSSAASLVLVIIVAQSNSVRVSCRWFLSFTVRREFAVLR